MTELINLMINNNIHLALITEPPVNRKTNHPYSIFSPFKALYTDDLSKMVRSIILLNPIIPKSTNIKLVPNKTSSDYVTISIQMDNNEDLYITSIYLDPATPIEDPSNPIQIITKFKTRNWLLTGDFNAQSPFWGSDTLNKKGKQITELIQDLDITSVIYRNTPTCVTTRENETCYSTIDATLISENIADRVTDYENSQHKIATTDHTTILFRLHLKIKITKQKSVRKRINYMDIEWERFQEKLTRFFKENNINTETIQNIITTEQLNQVTSTLTSSIIKAAKSSYTQQRGRTGGPKRQPWWWNSQIAEISNQIIQTKRKMKNCGYYRYEQLLSKKQDLSKAMTKAIHKSKNEQWTSFMQGTTEDTIWATIHIIQSKSKPKGTARLTDSQGEAINEAEAPRALAEALFNLTPITQSHQQLTNQSHSQDNTQSTNEAPEDRTNPNTNRTQHSSEQRVPDITQSEMELIFKSVGPKKAPGKDMLNSTICEHFRAQEPELLRSLYQKCLDLAAFPQAWKVSQIIPIHKEKKGPASNPKNYRPIGLLSLMAKGLEKIINNRITYHLISSNIIHPNQHGFTPTKSTISALSLLMEKISQYKTKYQYCAILALDIAGAFDNLPWKETIQQMANIKCPTTYTRIMENYFKDRQYEIIYGEQTYTFNPTKGCVQGSPLSPTLWNIIINPLLVETSKITHVQAYADDIIFLIGANSEISLNQNIQNINSTAQRWASKNSLKFAIEKTEFLLLKGTLKNTIHLGDTNQPLTPLKSIKLLGVTIDRKLTWKEHIAKAIIKATALHKIMNSICLKGMGVDSRFRKLCYNMVYIPTLLYGCEIWHTALKYKDTSKKLRENQRRILTKMTGAYNQSNLADLLVITNEISIDAKIIATASRFLLANNKNSMIQFKTEGYDIERKIYQFENTQPWNVPNLDNTITIQDHEKPIEHEKDKIYIYTDGACNNQGTGAAIIAYENNEEIKKRKIKLHQTCTIFQAEAIAIQEAIKFAVTHHDKRQKKKEPGLIYQILTDSRAVLQSLLTQRTTNPLISNITADIQKSQKKGISMKIKWIRGHKDHMGNLAADALAKEAIYYKKSPIYDAISLNKIKIATNTWAQEETKKFILHNISRNMKELINQENAPLTQIPHRFLTWLLTGKGPFKSYLKTIRRLNDSTCQCKKAEQSPKHLILECNIFEKEREDILKQRQITLQNLKTLLKKETGVSKLEDLAVIITEYLIREEKEIRVQTEN